MKRVHSFRLVVLAAFSVLIGACCERKEQTKEEPEVVDSLVAKLAEIEVGPFDFENVTFEEAMEFFRLRAIENDSGPVSQNGIGFVVRKPRQINDAEAALDDEAALGGNENAPLEPLITLKAGRVNLPKALDLICEEAECRWFIDREVLKIVIVPKDDQPEVEVAPKVDPKDPFSGN